MIWADSVIIAIVCTSAGVGLLRGLAGELLSLSTAALAIWIGMAFNHEFSVVLKLTVTNTHTKAAFSFVSLAFITLLIGKAIRTLLGNVIKNSDLEFFNRFWAMVFGSVHGCCIVTVLVLLAGLSPLPSEAWWQEALLLPPFQALALFLTDNISSELAYYVHYH